MSVYSQHGVCQIVGIIIVCVGCGLCLGCSVAPYWLTAEVSADDVKALTNISLDESIKNCTINVGIWWYCIDLGDKGEDCHSAYDPSEYKVWINIARATVVANVTLSFLAVLAVCCTCLCCHGRKTLCYGLLSVFGGIFGFAAALIFYLASDEGDLLKPNLIGELTLNMPYMFYIAGSFLVVVASFFLCFGQERDIEKIDP